MLKKTAVWLNRLLWTVMVTALVLVAAYVSIGRYYIRYIENYQQTLIQRLVDYTGLPITVGHLYGRWSRLSPILSMEDLKLVTPSGRKTVLTIGTVNFQIDALGSLLNGSLKVSKLFIDNVQCALLETRPGHWQLQGYPVSGGDSLGDFDSVVDLVLSVDGAELNDARVRMKFFKGETALLAVRELSLGRAADFRRLRLDASMDKSRHPVTGIIEARGDPRNTDSFSARAHFKLDDVDFSAQLPVIRPLGIELDQATVDSEIWVDWRPGAVITAQGYVHTPYLDVEALSGEPLQPVKDLSFNFHAEKSSGFDWRIWVPSFRAQWQDDHLLFNNMITRISDREVEFAIPQLSVDQAMKNLLAVRLLGTHDQKILETLSPQGQLTNLHLSYSLADTDTDTDSAVPPSQFTLRANLSGVSVKPWEGAPGAKGVNGYIEARPHSGLVDLDSKSLVLDFPHVYHHSLSFDSAQAQVRWYIGARTVQVKSGPIVVHGEHGDASGLLSLDLPLHHDEGIPLMDLAIGIRDTDAKYRNLFIPYTVDEHLHEWLDNSIRSGHVIEGGFIYRGSLVKHDADNRTVQLFFDVDNTTLDYHPDWPPLTDIRGLVMIDDHSVRVRSDHAKIYSLDVKPALVTAAPVSDGMLLKVNASASGDAADALKVVNSSAIDKLVGGAFKEWQLSGQTSATVKLAVPLSGSAKPGKIDVAVQLAGSRLTIPEAHVTLTDINGPLRYRDSSGIASSGLRANLYGKPLKATVSQDKRGAVTVDIRGRADMKDVADWSRQPAMTFVSGTTDFDARVYIAPRAGDEAGEPSVFTVNSQLQGVAIDLPAPYGKAAPEARSFWLRQPLAGGYGMLQMGIQDQAELQVQFDKGEAVSGTLVLGKAPKAEHFPGLFLITGTVDQFNLDNWQPVLDRYLRRERELAKGRPSQPGLALAASDLSIGVFEGFSQRFEKCTLDMRQRSDGWWLSVLNPMFDGEAFIPAAQGQPPSVRLDRLTLPDSALSGDGNGEGMLSSLDVGKLDRFAAYVAIADLKVGDESYGSLNFKLQTEPGELQLNYLGGVIRGIRIGVRQPAHFLWQRTTSGDQSRLEGDFDFADIGKVLDNWHYERFIESKNGSGAIDFSWPGRPDQWQLKTSSGPIELKLKDGRFLKASETASGTLKVVGVVNLMNVVRRLRLDFSDLTKKGISYDRVEGKATLADHKLTIADNLVVKTPSSGFQMHGTADLDTRQLDMELVVTLPVASNLPWLAALAGGLPTAAGVYVASKIFESEVDRLSSAVYTVSGDWDNPELKFRRVFDDSSSKKRDSQSKSSGSPASKKGIKP